MGNGLIAFLVAVAAAAWIYGKSMKQTGNNTKSALTVAGLSAACIFVVVLVILGIVFKQ